MIKQIIFLLLILACIDLSAQVDTTQYKVPGRTNHISQQNKPYVILISADAFRYDFAKKYNAQNLLSLSKHGVRAASMIPSFPSLTFPNHYTIATGMYPSHHGLVNNDFYDPQRNETYALSKKKTVEDGTWYGGVPLWVLAEQQQMLTASFYWVGSEANIKGILPTYYYRYNEKIPIDKRIQVVVDWLNLPVEKRPHLITFYFPEVDHDAHDYGTDSPEVERSVKTLDSSIQKLTQAVKATGLPVNFIFVSDHGMVNVDTINTIKSLPAGVDTSKFLIPSGGILVSMHAKNKDDIQPTYSILKSNEKNYTAYLKKDIPAKYHFNAEDDKYNRVGDIILVPKWPMVFNLKKRKVSLGWHGYDPALVKEMHATFFAWGPAFKKKKNIPSFENVHVYPLITELLGLNYHHEIDGKKSVLKKILKKK
jgi:predicted AlkP superfamily pyrophosphatase or phosphodiesterase